MSRYMLVNPSIVKAAIGFGDTKIEARVEKTARSALGQAASRASQKHPFYPTGIGIPKCVVAKFPPDGLKHPAGSSESVALFQLLRTLKCNQSTCSYSTDFRYISNDICNEALCNGLSLMEGSFRMDARLRLSGTKQP